MLMSAVGWRWVNSTSVWWSFCRIRSARMLPATSCYPWGVLSLKQSLMMLMSGVGWRWVNSTSVWWSFCRNRSARMLRVTCRRCLKTIKATSPTFRWHSTAVPTHRRVQSWHQRQLHTDQSAQVDSFKHKPRILKSVEVSALEVNFNVMRSVNSRFTYFLAGFTFLVTAFRYSTEEERDKCRLAVLSINSTFWSQFSK